MVNHEESLAASRHPSPLVQWLIQTIGIPGLQVKSRLRGNNLHILCEATATPERITTLSRLLNALKTTDINILIAPNHPSIYHLFLYGRMLGHKQPHWSAILDLNQLDRHLEQLQHLQVNRFAQISSERLVESNRSRASSSGRASQSPHLSGRGAESSSTLVLTNLSQARRGQPDAIARYLGEVLSGLGVAVQVTVKRIPYTTKPDAALPTISLAIHRDASVQRLWITCEAPYSPDPFLIARPIAQRLRELALDGFRDAITVIQVQGEAKPDWLLRVDLTPPAEMLREWARWGDIEAIAILVNQALADLNVQLTHSSLKDATLHLFVGVAPESGSEGSLVPDRQAIRAALLPLLEILAPQGVQAATLYGQVKGQDALAWVDYLELPASQHPALAEPAMTLAEQGDWEAIAFLLTRLLNPNLEDYLETGGIRIQLLPKGSLLHVMTDALLCPEQTQVGPVVAQFLKPLQISGIEGIRIYGRQAGQKRPWWSYGVDYQERQRFVPEAIPEFAATAAYVNDLIATTEDLVLRPDLTSEDVKSAWNRFYRRTVDQIRTMLIRSQCFLPDAEVRDLLPAAQPTTPYRGMGLALIWGAAGVLLMVQADWGMARLLQSPPPIEREAAPTIPQVASSPASTSTDPPATPAPLPSISLRQSDEDDADVFNTGGFTQPSQPTLPTAPQLEVNPLTGERHSSPFLTSSVSLPYTPRSVESQLATAALISGNSPFPTFNSRQLDEKLALYYQRLAKSGTPDVLIVGSSRALRGIDPVALQQSLKGLGYDDVSIFNFGVNGATAQVVDLILRQILKPDQLPQLIIWADGARAFNSGGVDVTYNGIAVSEGYRELTNGTLPTQTLAELQVTQGYQSPATATTPSSGLGASLTRSYQEIDRWLSDRLSHISQLHQGRDRLWSVLQTHARTLMPSSPTAEDARSPNPSLENAQATLGDEQGMIDFDGFLPLSLRFNPATYYQKYARVAGQYDSDYADFQLEGKQTQALESVLEFTRAHNVSVVFVNLPLTQDYLDPTRMSYEQAFKEFMVAQSLNQPEFGFRDLSEIWLTEHDYFSDPSHLNRYGAYEVSNRLVQDPMMPWSRLK